MTHRHGEGVNHLYGIVASSPLPDKRLPNLACDPPQILPLLHQGAAVRQVRELGTIVFSKIPRDLFVGLHPQKISNKLDRQRLLIRQCRGNTLMTKGRRESLLKILDNKAIHVNNEFSSCEHGYSRSEAAKNFEINANMLGVGSKRIKSKTNRLFEGTVTEFRNTLTW
jgi:hypothetical protein